MPLFKYPGLPFSKKTDEKHAANGHTLHNPPFLKRMNKLIDKKTCNHGLMII
jgi:hypothetical protein